MAVSLVQILATVLKADGKALNEAQRDLARSKAGLNGFRVLRNLLAQQLRDLKKKRLEADRNGGGAKAAKVVAEINFIRQILNEITMEQTMVRLNTQQCAAYVKQQTDYIRSVDAEWEKAKADETSEQA